MLQAIVDVLKVENAFGVVIIVIISQAGVDEVVFARCLEGRNDRRIVIVSRAVNAKVLGSDGERIVVSQSGIVDTAVIAIGRSKSHQDRNIDRIRQGNRQCGVGDTVTVDIIVFSEEVLVRGNRDVRGVRVKHIDAAGSDHIGIGRRFDERVANRYGTTLSNSLVQSDTEELMQFHNVIVRDGHGDRLIGGGFGSKRDNPGLGRVVVEGGQCGTVERLEVNRHRHVDVVAE